MNTPRHTEDDIDPVGGLSSAPLRCRVSRTRRVTGIALDVIRFPSVLLLIAGLFVESTLTKARHALHDWRAARRQAAEARRESRAGEYPIIDRPLTFGERQARRRRDRKKS